MLLSLHSRSSLEVYWKQTKQTKPVTLLKMKQISSKKFLLKYYLDLGLIRLFCWEFFSEISKNNFSKHS